MASQWWSGPQYIAVGIYRRKSSTIAVMPSRDERLHSSWASACDTPSDVLILHSVWFYDSEPYYLGFWGQSSFNKCENMAHFFCKSLIADQPLCWAWSCATLLEAKVGFHYRCKSPALRDVYLQSTSQMTYLPEGCWEEDSTHLWHMPKCT